MYLWCKFDVQYIEYFFLPATFKAGFPRPDHAANQFTACLYYG